jgi:alpha-L-rhamnosidase
MDTQTAYAVAIFMGLVPEEAKERVSKDFKLKLRDNGYLLNTGFVGTAYLCMALSESGWNDIAYRLLLNKQFPSWLYEVEMGATTVWERWNSVLPDGRISSTGMNSLNHYAYGSIASWMYRYMAGIKPLEEVPGFRKAVIAPLPNRRLAHAKATVATPCGTYESAWSYQGEKLSLQITIPFGAEAEVILPYSLGCEIESNVDAELIKKEGNSICCNLTAGSYEFTYIPNQEKEEIYSLDSNLNELLDNEKTRGIVAKYFPTVFHGIPFQDEASTLREVVQSPFAEISDSDILKLDDELRNI